MGGSGFVVTGSGGYGGGPLVTGGPPSTGGGTDTDGTVPGVGPAAAPSNLIAVDVFLAIQLSWDNPAFNLQHIEIWRSLVNDRADLTEAAGLALIGTTVAPIYTDYVGAEATFYYWVRAVATDGTYSPWNALATEGVEGTTGVDPGAWEANLSIASSNLNAALAARIDLIDVDTLQDSLLTRVTAIDDITGGTVVAVDQRVDTVSAQYTSLDYLINGGDPANPGELGLLADYTATALVTNTNTAGIVTINDPLIDGSLPDLDGRLTVVDDPTTGDLVVLAQRVTGLEAALGTIDSAGGIEWDFTADVDGFTTTNAEALGYNSSDDLIIFQTIPVTANPQLNSETISLNGGIFTQVVARIKLVSGSPTTTWEGRMYYSTNASANLHYKTLAWPALALGQWTELIWDMTDITYPTGGADHWTNNTITGIRLDLDSGTGPSGLIYHIDWIYIAKYSTTALSSAIAALDARVTVNDGIIGGHGTSITALQTFVGADWENNVAGAAAVSALTTDVFAPLSPTTALRYIAEASASSITALQAFVGADWDANVASATAVDRLTVSVYTEGTGIEDLSAANAAQITQLFAQVGGGTPSIVNPLTTVDENFGTTYAAGDIQVFNVGGRSGVAARIDTNLDVLHAVGRSDATRILVNDNDIYQVKFTCYHDRPTNKGMFAAGLFVYDRVGPPDDDGDTQWTMQAINNGVAGVETNTPLFIRHEDSAFDEQWLDVTCYIVGRLVDITTVPRMKINGFTPVPADYSVVNDAYRVVNLLDKHVVLRFLNYNSDPVYGDDSLTTTYVTNVVVRPYDSEADNSAALQVQITANADSLGNLDASYVVKAELTSGGIPYVSGFGLYSQVDADNLNTDPLLPFGARSSFGIRADQFFLASPLNTDDTKIPFTIDTLVVPDPLNPGETKEVVEIGMSGELIIKGSLNAETIVSNSITGTQINTPLLIADIADIGILTGGLIKTADSPAFRVEIEDQAGTQYPLWYGKEAKSEGTGLFWVNQDGDVVVKGLLEAGMIKQSYFAPAGDNQSFRVATEYPNKYTAGVYSGNKAHINTLQHMNFYSSTNFGTSIFSGGTYFGWTSNSVGFVGPFESSNEEYARLGSYSEMILIDIGCQIEISGEAQGATKTHYMYLQYRYDSEGWKDAYYIPIRQTSAVGAAALNHVSAFHSQVFVSRSTPTFNTLNFRLRAAAATNATTTSQIAVVSASLKASTPNFGYANATVNDYTGSTPRIDLIAQHGTWA